MTLVTVKPTIVRPRVTTSALDRLFDEFFRTDFPVLNNGNGVKSVPAVNLIETADNFRLEIAAPGLDKHDFTVNVDKDVLTIVVGKKANRPEGEKVRKMEFYYGDFKHTFRLPNTIDAGAIEATYQNGVLYVTLPKREEAKPKPARTIAVA